mgnify:FL=1
MRLDLRMPIEDHRFLMEMSAARGITTGALMREVMACYRTALEREVAEVEREEKAARRAERKALAEEVDF